MVEGIREGSSSMPIFSSKKVVTQVDMVSWMYWAHTIFWSWSIHFVKRVLPRKRTEGWWGRWGVSEK